MHWWKKFNFTKICTIFNPHRLTSFLMILANQGSIWPCNKNLLEIIIFYYKNNFFMFFICLKMFCTKLFGKIYCFNDFLMIHHKLFPFTWSKQPEQVGLLGLFQNGQNRPNRHEKVLRRWRNKDTKLDRCQKIMDKNIKFR